MIPCDLDIASTTFSNKIIITYKIELPTSGNYIVLNVLDYEYFTFRYVTDTTPNSPDIHQIPTQDKHNAWIIAINREESIKYQVTLDKLNCHQTRRGKSKVKISLYRTKIYHRTYLKEIISIFDQV